MEIAIKVVTLIISLLAIIVAIVAMIRLSKSERDLTRALENLNRAREDFLKNSCDNYAGHGIVDDARATIDGRRTVWLQHPPKSVSRLVDTVDETDETH